MTVFLTSPCRNSMSVGIDITLNLTAVSWFSSMLSLTTLRVSPRSVAISSTTGDTRRHGPHHGAQKSTSTGTSDSMTSAWKLLSVTSVTGPAMFIFLLGSRRASESIACRARPLGLISVVMADPTNSEIAAALDELGDLYELDGAVIHRIVAYRNAAKAARDAPVSVTALAREGRATELPGVGAIIQEKVLALADEGAIPAAVKLRAKFPAGLLEITRLPGLGPKRARRLFEELSIDSLQALEAAATAQRIRTLKGFGPKAEQSILASVEAARADAESDGDNGSGSGRVVLHRALAIGEQLVDALRAHPAAVRVELAGSARRMTDSVKDLDVIATASDPLALAQAAAGLELVEAAQNPSASGVRLRTHTGLKVDLRIVAPDQFGNLMQHFTGSKQHNMALREAAVRKGLHVSDYGVLDDATGETSRCEREEEVYALLGLAYIEPELRENRGELEAAAAGTLPDLIALGDLRGDLHCHTTASDGTASIEEMAQAARATGYEYLAITDHSASFGFGNEVSSARLHEQIARIRELSGSDDAGGITLLAGSE